MKLTRDLITDELFGLVANTYSESGRDESISVLERAIGDKIFATSYVDEIVANEYTDVVPDLKEAMSEGYALDEERIISLKDSIRDSKEKWKDFVDYEVGDWVETCSFLPGIVQEIVEPYIHYDVKSWYGNKIGTLLDGDSVHIFYPSMKEEYPSYTGGSNCSVFNCGVHKISEDYAKMLFGLGRERLSDLFHRTYDNLEENDTPPSWQDTVVAEYHKVFDNASKDIIDDRDQRVSRMLAIVEQMKNEQMKRKEEIFRTSHQYKVWSNELKTQKSILRSLDRSNKEASDCCLKRISELKQLMKL